MPLSQPLLSASAPPRRFTALPNAESAGAKRLAFSISNLTNVLLWANVSSKRVWWKSASKQQSELFVPLTGPSWQQVAVQITSTVVGAGVLGLVTLRLELSIASQTTLACAAPATSVARFRDPRFDPRRGSRLR